MALTPFISSVFRDPFALSPFEMDPFAGLGFGSALTPSLAAPMANIHDLEALSAAPAVEVRDSENKFDLLLKPPPGMDARNIHVRLDRDVLHITGQHEERQETATSKRQTRRNFARYYRLPENVDQQAIKAKWTDAGLCVELPKKAGALEAGRQIAIEGVGSGMGMEKSQPQLQSSAAHAPSKPSTERA